MGIAFVVGQAGDISASPPDNPDTDKYCRHSRHMTIYKQSTMYIHVMYVLNMLQIQSLFQQTTCIQRAVYIAEQHYTI